jgi:hypothetical protein
VMVGYKLPDTWGPWPFVMGQSPANSSSASLAGRLRTVLLRSQSPHSFPKLAYGKVISCSGLGIETLRSSYEVNHFVP